MHKLDYPTIRSTFSYQSYPDSMLFYPNIPLFSGEYINPDVLRLA
jgi:hypothetical protein